MFNLGMISNQLTVHSLKTPFWHLVRLKWAICISPNKVTSIRVPKREQAESLSKQVEDIEF